MSIGLRSRMSPEELSCADCGWIHPTEKNVEFPKKKHLHFPVEIRLTT
jgi:hypothetical protein